MKTSGSENACLQPTWLLALLVLALFLRLTGMEVILQTSNICKGLKSQNLLFFSISCRGDLKSHLSKEDPSCSFGWGPDIWLPSFQRLRSGDTAQRQEGRHLWGLLVSCPLWCYVFVWDEIFSGWNRYFCFLTHGSRIHSPAPRGDSAVRMYAFFSGLDLLAGNHWGEFNDQRNRF